LRYIKPEMGKELPIRVASRQQLLLAGKYRVQIETRIETPDEFRRTGSP